VSVRPHSSPRISRSILSKFGTDVQDRKSKNEFVNGRNRTTTSGVMRMRSILQC